jgi:hypothetical protein
MFFFVGMYSIRSEIGDLNLSRYNVWRHISVLHLHVAKPLTTIIGTPKHWRLSAVQSCSYKHEIGTIFTRGNLRKDDQHWQTKAIENQCLFFYHPWYSLKSLAGRTYPSTSSLGAIFEWSLWWNYLTNFLVHAPGLKEKRGSSATKTNQ